VAVVATGAATSAAAAGGAVPRGDAGAAPTFAGGDGGAPLAAARFSGRSNSPTVSADLYVFPSAPLRDVEPVTMPQ
jgi:hypothetical protein